MTCEKITYFIEKGYLTELNISEKLQVKLHTLYCTCCKNYPKDSVAINKMLAKLGEDDKRQTLSVDEKQQLKDLLDGLNT